MKKKKKQQQETRNKKQKDSQQKKAYKKLHGMDEVEGAGGGGVQYARSIVTPPPHPRHIHRGFNNASTSTKPSHLGFENRRLNGKMIVITRGAPLTICFPLPALKAFTGYFIVTGFLRGHTHHATTNEAHSTYVIFTET